MKNAARRAAAGMCGAAIVVSLGAAWSVWVAGAPRTAPPPIPPPDLDWALQQPDAILDSRYARISESVADIDGRLGRNETSVQTLEQRLSRLESEWSRGTVAVGSSQAADEERHQVALSRAILIEDAIETEPVDTNWSASATIALDEMFRGEALSGIDAVQTDCGNTLCRTRLFLDTTETDDRGQLRNLVASLPWPGESWLRIEDAESGAAVLYLAREGHSLPR